MEAVAKAEVKARDVKSVRIPSEGQQFELEGIDFEVKHVARTRIKCITTGREVDVNKMLSIKKGESFKLLGAKYLVEGFRCSNRKATMFARAK